MLQRPVGFHVGCRVASDRRADIAHAAVGAGFDGAELALRMDIATHADAIDKELTALAGSGGGVLAVAVSCGTTNVDEAVGGITAVLRAAASAGARSLNVTLPPVDAASGGFAGYQEALNYAYRLMREGRYEAESSGVPLALEAACGGCLLSPAELREVIDKANSWAVGACVDVDRVRAIGRVGDWLATLGPRVHCVRISRGEAVGGAWPVDLDSLRNAMDDAGYGGPIVLGGDEPENLADARRCVVGRA